MWYFINTLTDTIHFPSENWAVLLIQSSQNNTKYDNLPVLEGKEFIFDFITKLSSTNDLENLGQFPAQEVLALRYGWLCRIDFHNFFTIFKFLRSTNPLPTHYYWAAIFGWSRKFRSTYSTWSRLLGFCLHYLYFRGLNKLTTRIIIIILFVDLSNFPITFPCAHQLRHSVAPILFAIPGTHDLHVRPCRCVCSSAMFVWVDTNQHFPILLSWDHPQDSSGTPGRPEPFNPIHIYETFASLRCYAKLVTWLWEV